MPWSVGVGVAELVGVGVWVGVVVAVRGAVGDGTAVTPISSGVAVKVGVGVFVASIVGDGIAAVLATVAVAVGVSVTNSMGKIESTMMGSGAPPGWQAVQSVGMAALRM